MRNDPASDPGHSPSGLLGWLGLGRQAHDTAPAPRNPSRDFLRQARRELVERVGAFLAEHDLEVTPGNLAIAHGVVSGLNPGLARQINKRCADGQRITQDWLQRAAASRNHGEHAIDLLAERLEQGIDDFSRSTEHARSATRNYGDALAVHMDQLDAQPDAGKVISDLAAYARAMLDRSRRAEAELKESEQEAAALRRNLELARRDAEYDFLTGLPNRRAFEATLETEYAAARESGESLVVAFCDIDHFKRVNDTHGHEAGDRIICVVGKALAAISGERCHIARHGGEEFVVLFRGLPLEEARTLLDGARAQLAERKLVNRRTEQPFGQITFSGGLADVFAYPGAREALAAADEALYQAKEHGRNQVRIAGESA
ncbi:MAG: GGDEF domain-containing protein [Erythrobacter sp.]|nr:GGDEF domain-containing protein [Erythrobacter sp.]